MNNPIMLTPHDIWNIFLAICGALVAVSAAVAVVVKVIEHIKAPDKRQDKRITDLETAVEKINQRLESGNRRFEADAKQFEALQSAFKASNKVIIESLQALTAHALDQNSLGELHEAKKRLDEYLRER